MASFPFYLDSRCACFWILPRVVFILYMLCICMLWLWCFCAECWMLNALHEDSSCEKKHARLLMWCCENCAIAEGCLLEVSWPFLAYEKHTWCWGGYFRFTLSKARLFTCAGDATHVVRRGCSRSYLACCTCISAWQKCPIEPLGKESGWLLWRATELRTPFFQTLKRAHFLKSGRKKRYTFLCTNGRFRYKDV